MTQPPVPPPTLPPPPPSQGAGVQVRCAGCRMILTVAPGVTEFVCPTCQMPQMLPPELIGRQQKSPNLPAQVPAHGIDPTKIQLPCAHCKAILNVPHGLTRFSCPQCGVDLAVDLSKIKHFLPRLPPPPPEEVNEVAIEVEREEDEGGTVGETFMDYHPPKLSIGPSHPDPIVETSSLSAVQPPEPTYDLKIRDDLESSNALSCLQIETLVYACQRHLQHLPNGSRAGFFIGDGAGVGKGRTIAGLIWENWQHGRRKALARLPEARVIYCSATGASEPRNMGYMVRLGLWGAGTCFTDFQKFLGALDKGGVGALELVAMDMKARGMYVCRTLSYKGAEFEVVEAPLEAKMEEMYKKAAEFWAELRVELLSVSTFLSNEKPNSSQLWRLYWSSHQRFFRHICMSAKVPVTVRLAKQALLEDKCVVIGLQSTGEARTEEAVTKYGLELDDFVSGPRELLLKFVEENYPLPEKPEPIAGEESVKELQRKRHLASPGVSLKGRVRKVSKWKPTSDGESDEESETDSAHESTESDDEFQICEICNCEEERKKLLQCSCCGQLVHLACLVPPLTDLVSEEWSCHSCKEKTDEYIEARRAYVAELLKRYEAAVERKSKILEIVRSLDVPNNPLDDIIDQLGGPEKVAEMTGRRGMLVRASNGKGVTYQARNTKDVTMEMVNMHEKQLFMDGKKLVAIISEAGSAGVSLQADRRAINHKVHLTLELPWSADRAFQQFGRTHRSNQASAPKYRLLFTNLGGERRFASIVAKRLESLGALTQGDRRAGPSLSAYNYDSAYGKKALMVMYRGIMEQDTMPVVPPGCSSENPETIQDFITKAKAALVSVGIVRDTALANGKDYGKFSGRIVDSDMHDVGRFLNRLLGLPPDIQNRLFELFVSILDVLIQNARIEGNLDSGIVDVKANIIELEGTPKTVHVDQMSGATTMLFTFNLDRGITWESASTMLEEKKKDGLGSANDGFYESKREWLGRRHFILAFESAASGMFKIVRPAIGEAVREMPLAELKYKYRQVSSLEKACNGWKDEYEVSSKQCMHGPNCKLGSFCTVGRRVQEVNVLGGLILPVWGTIEKALSKQARQSHKRIRVVRLETTTDNQRIVGLLVPNAAVETVLQDLAWVQDIDD
ncbi:LOW QUALITY PROTEIN: protein FORGETTER 1 [Carica papaya]|uniref:LOW QUALITY PROTEIN: protein FORGETTER 1 n=1 Tax=Carica papaya TaxID=3649 RepID=UPI000B8CC16B|nr:LOW QUALITY PROTEIN: protein FORGETTER 1 [Carica papaya]